MGSLGFAAFFSLLCCVSAAAQDNVIARARAAADAGDRPAGLALLETHLASAPRDADARLVYGLILSWEGRYDEARQALTDVLAQSPDYLDARVALMNVEWWSGRLPQARELVRAVLTRDAGNAQARYVQQRLDARTRPWSLGLTSTRDTFNDEREPWQETALTLGRETPAGSLFVRGRQGDRFGLTDQQVDLEFYPTFRPGTYAFVGVGVGSDEVLYPEYRVSFDLYQSLGGGFEVSGGYRRLAFTDATDIYLATLTKYAGHWMITGKAFVVPDPELGDAWSYHAQVRRYFGAAGTSFIGGGYSRGYSREEPRGAGDLIRVDADTIRGQAEIDLTDRLQLTVAASTSRQERSFREPYWQTTSGAGLKIRF
ncbi:MAG: YaiO family outer membrane beta-barrel protein [Acidobacteriota bacterium]|nr:YaiO family outer membrane beta-barrel protein [Acidobacteriota bacterium]